MQVKYVAAGTTVRLLSELLLWKMNSHLPIGEFDSAEVLVPIMLSDTGTHESDRETGTRSSASVSGKLV